MAPMLVQEVEEDEVSASIATTLELTPVEETLTKLLLDVAEYVDENPESEAGLESQIALPQELANEKLTLRYTGGWVRDKLLGVPSHDIDVAINKMTGYQFGLRMKEYLELPGNLSKYGLESIAENEKQNAKAGTTDKSKTVGGLHKIEANPEKSKHLETTTMRILGLDIDLVNLRKETYSDDSRNPQVEFGTPEEDALRRDATVNAMFYNLNTKEIEDFTGRGHEDMAAKIIRTPLEPYQTFKDDPLRVLRLIRFASRLGYTIESAVLQAARDSDIKEALRRKISRERVGTELEKSLQGPDPHEALRLIFDLDLYGTIFSDPVADHYHPDTNGWKTIINTLQEIVDSGEVLAENLTRDAEERYFAWQLAAMVPYRDAPQPQSAPGKKALPPVAVTVAKEGFKATNRVADVIGASVRNSEEISNFVDKLHEMKRRPDKKLEGEEDVTARDVLGMAMRRWGASWRSQVMYSILVEIADNPSDVDSIQRKYTTFLTHLSTLSLLDVISQKPLLDGKTLAKAIGTPPGPWMKEALDVVMAWQLRNPEITDPAEAIEEVKRGRGGGNGELKNDLVRHFLKLTIRPLFSKSKTPSGITAQGRKAVSEPLPRKVGMGGGALDTPVWKEGKEGYVVDILRWVVSNLDGGGSNKSIVGEVWPLIIPPLLTLVDDWETRYKALGAELIGNLLQVVEPELLARTGLGEVFEEALVGCLVYLPPTTPEDEAVSLLEAVYPALLALSKGRFPSSPITTSEQEQVLRRKQQTKFLDKILRDGVIYGLTHCSQTQHARIQTFLFEQLALFLDELAIDSVKHIKYILPLLTQTLSHPLAGASLPMLQKATGAMQSLLRNAWPRMLEYRGEVLKGVAICWLTVLEKDGEEVEDLRRALKETVQLLSAAVREEHDLREDCEVLVEADGRLRGLLLP